MRVIRGWRGLGAGDRGATAALGNFDGVHRGHRALLARARDTMTDAPLALVTFEPHPRRHFQPDAAPFRLTAPAERARILDGLGLDLLYELRFDAALAAMEPETFAAEVLGQGLGLAHLVIGEDFRFGRARRGTAEMLAALGPANGYSVAVERLLAGGGGAFSSSGIRAHLREGRVVEAAAALGRWHTVSGPVVQGDRRGRELGYPTANLAFGDQLVPAYGIYAARVTVHEGPHAGCHDGVASIGERPTFGINAPNFEVHLFDFAGDLYGAEISVALVAWLRGEERFASAEALVEQMHRDSAAARAALARAGRPWEDGAAAAGDPA